MAVSQHFLNRYTRALTEPHCDHCGFTLATNSDRGCCPECGTDFDPQSVCIARTMRRLPVLGYLALPICVAITLVVVMIVIDAYDSLSPMAIASFLAPAFFAIAWCGFRAQRMTLVVFARCMPRRRAESALCIALSGVSMLIGFAMIFGGIVLAGLVFALGMAVQSGLDA
ncbi:MAG: hypothetical protein QM516_00665 [Limnohabitans sp.]|nr:hypothetical protein [Limnohabitans sp.]